MDISLPDLYGPITIDTETHDPLLTERGSGWAYDRSDQHGGKIIGYAIHADNFHEYLPVGHTEGNMDRSKVVSWLKYQLNRDPSQPKIFANILYDMGWMYVEGIPFEGNLHDVQYQAALLDEARLSYQLDRLGKDYLNEGKDETLLKEAGEKLGIKNSKKDNVKKHLARIHPDIVGVYAKQDAALTRKLWDHFTPLMAAEDLGEVYQLEMDLVPMLLQMRLRGVKVDVEKARIEQKNFLVTEAESRAYIKDLSGITLGSWDNAGEIAAILDKLGIPYGLTEKTQAPSITAGYLRSLEHPIGGAILSGRKASNLRSTFVENAILDLQQGGRIYPNFNQLRKDEDDGSSGVIGKAVKTRVKGTVSGRFSSSGPNFQQIPSPERDPELGYLIRSLILPEDGEYWWGLDYSAQEPRVIVHFAELISARKASIIGDQYRANPKTDFHMVVRDLVRTAIPTFERKPAKIVGLGLAYGMGGGKMARDIGLDYYTETFEKDGKEIEFLKPGPEAKAILDAFDKEAPFIRELAQSCQKTVRRRGYIHTPLGRRFRFPKDGNGRYMFLNKALNRLIQGTSADMTKRALLEMHKAGILPHGTVHDEIDISTSDIRVVKQAQEIMTTCFPLTIPIAVDIGAGRNWGEASDPYKSEAFIKEFFGGQL